LVTDLNPEMILPNPFNKDISIAVSQAIKD